MKKFLIGALAALAVLGVSSFSEAQAEYENACCRGNYYCDSDCDDGNYSGEYCGRYGCVQDDYRGGCQ